MNSNTTGVKMNQNLIADFIKRAQAAGLTKEQAEKFITENVLDTKTAAAEVDKLVTSILKSANVEKTVESSAYVESFLKTAVENGCDTDQAIQLAKIVLSKTSSLTSKRSVVKKAETEQEKELVAYAESFLKAASDVGLNKEQGIEFLKIAIQKQSNDPSVIQNLLAMLSGGAGGMEGLGAGGATPEAGLGEAGGQIPPSLLASILEQLGQGGAQGGGLFKQLPEAGA